MLDANTVEKQLADTQTSRAPIPVNKILRISNKFQGLKATGRR
jgi:hypothetical protein